MNKLGLKASLLISTLLLVALSVTAASVISYLEQKRNLTKSIMQQSQTYVESRAALIEAMLNEKVSAVDKLSAQFSQQPLPSEPAAAIELTKIVAKASNTGSAVLAYNTGEGYWSQAGEGWPNHRYSGDVTQRPWYKEAMKASGVTVSEPYLGTEGSYWVTIIERVSNGTISIDMQLAFLNDLVEPSAAMKGAVAVIVNQDSTLLASSSADIKTGQKAFNFDWFNDAITNAINSDYTVSHYHLNGDDKLLFSKRINVGDKQWVYALGLNESVAFAALNSARNTAIIIAILATLVSVIIAYFVIQVSYRPVVSLRQTVRDLSSGNGDLTQRLAVTSNDDIGNISADVNTFIGSLQAMMKEVKVASEELQQNISGLRRQSAKNSELLENHVTETEQIATAVEEMDATANAMSADASNTASITEQASRTSDESKAIVESSEKAVLALVADVKNAANDVQAMSDEVNNISSILGVIGEVAEQTNLLALNAAIEAARAGDQGRGFAVVADEVRELANRTTASTRKIEDAITALLNRCSNVERSMAETQKRCEETAKGSQEVAVSLDALTDFVREINALSGQIATASEEQSCVTKDVSKNMTAISDIVVTLNRYGDEALEGAESIDNINTRLVSIVGRFKI